MEIRKKTNYYLKLKGHELFVGRNGLYTTIRNAHWINRDRDWTMPVAAFKYELRETYLELWLDTFTSEEFEIYTNNGRAEDGN